MVGFIFFDSCYLIRIGEACSIRARKKIAPVKQFLTQVTFLLVCELVTTTRNKLYKSGDRSELVNVMNLRAREDKNCFSEAIFDADYAFVSL